MLMSFFFLNFIFRIKNCRKRKTNCRRSRVNKRSLHLSIFIAHHLSLQNHWIVKSKSYSVGHVLPIWWQLHEKLVLIGIFDKSLGEGIRQISRLTRLHINVFLLNGQQQFAENIKLLIIWCLVWYWVPTALSRSSCFVKCMPPLHEIQGWK